MADTEVGALGPRQSERMAPGQVPEPYCFPWAQHPQGQDGLWGRIYYEFPLGSIISPIY